MAHEVAQYQPEGLGMNSLPIALNKASMRKFEDLEIPCDFILASYVWIDGSGIHMRSKDRTFNFVPKTNKDLPIWYFDGYNTLQAAPDNSDTYIFPQVIYHDPFRRGSNILVLCDTYTYTYQPTSTSFRKSCLVLCEKGDVEEPWFGFNQEFMLTTADGRPLGWPPGGFPAPPGPYYCAVGANRVVARDLVEAFYRCCLYAGVQLNGINPGTTPSQWNFQVGPSPGIKGADDLWMARYILSRLAEDYGIVASFEPQPVPNWPGNGTFAYFSSKDMREDDGILVIERAIDKLARRHGAHINEYDANNGADNVRRLVGKHGMPHIKDFTAVSPDTASEHGKAAWRCGFVICVVTNHDRCLPGVYCHQICNTQGPRVGIQINGTIPRTKVSPTEAVVLEFLDKCLKIRKDI